MYLSFFCHFSLVSFDLVLLFSNHLHTFEHSLHGRYVDIHLDPFSQYLCAFMLKFQLLWD